MLITDKEIIEKLNAKGLQSVRHLEHGGVMYSIYIEKGFKKIGWLAKINYEYYGTVAKLDKILKSQMDDIIDHYLITDQNAKQSIDKICQNSK